MSPEPTSEQEEAEAAAREAAAIGGVAGDEHLAPEERPVLEGGGGEAEGFEAAEELLVEHASHGDEQSAHAILHRTGREEQSNLRHEDGEADRELSSELDDDETPERG